MKVVCPMCDYEYEIITRNRVGTGTKRAVKLRMNKNRELLLNILKDAEKPLKVNDVLFKVMLFERESRNGIGWNYHTVQQDLSNLVGMGKIKMSNSIDIFDEDRGWITEKIPHYEAKEEGLV